MVILLILINGLLATLHVEEQWVAKWCSFTRRRFARAIIDAKALRDLFMNILHIFTLRVYSFHIVERNLSPSTLITFYISLKFKRIFFFTEFTYLKQCKLLCLFYYIFRCSLETQIEILL